MFSIKINQNDVFSISKGKYPLKLKCFNLLILLKKRLLLFLRGKYGGQNNIENIKKYNISKESFYTDNKKNGISGIGRFKNAGDFLDIVVRNKIDFFDEIVLIDNNSDDNTWDICKKIHDDFPEKVKIYKYEPEVYSLGSNGYDSVDENSVHCNSYYYNRCFSKANYKYVMKIDDDNLFDPNVLEKIRADVLSKKLKRLYLLPGLNVIKTVKGYGVSNKRPLVGLHSDFGVFRISNRTYFVKDKHTQNFIHPYGIKYYRGISFFHLKFLKKGFGFHNLDKKKKEKLEKDIGNRIKDSYEMPNYLLSQFQKIFIKK